MTPEEADSIVDLHVRQLAEHFDRVQIIASLPEGSAYVGRKGGKIKLTVAEKFWARVDRTGGKKACWPFSGGYKAKGGHGQIVIGTRKSGGILIGSHRLAWTLTNGPIPDGMCVCHRCDNPPCCNPSHLFLGTASENFADMRNKGRARGGSLPGERNRNSKLTSQQVIEIREKYRSGKTQREIGEEYGIGQTSVSYIVSQGGWRHL